MQSIIILGKIENTKEKLEEIIKENHISKFDVEIITSEKAIGIGDAKALQKNLFLKPFESAKKAVILETFYGATQEAQNALLKVLEEPPQSAIMIILTTSLDFILPTIISRCNLIDLTKKSLRISQDLEKYNELLNNLIDHKENPLVIAQTHGKDKESALEFLQNLMIVTESNLNINPELGKALKKLQKSYSIIKSTNVNVRFALENLFLNL